MRWTEKVKQQFHQPVHRASSQHRLRIEPALEDELRGDLVDDFAAFLHIASDLVERALRGDGGEPLVRISLARHAG